MSLIEIDIGNNPIVNKIEKIVVDSKIEENQEIKKITESYIGKLIF